MEKYFKWMLPLIIAAALMLWFSASSCTKENNFTEPSIEFMDGEGFVFSDTTIGLNEQIKIGLRIKSNSDSQIVHLNRTIDRDGVISTLETALFDMELIITTAEPKGLAETEIWSFYCRDRDGRQSDTISLTVSLEGGPLNTR